MRKKQKVLIDFAEFGKRIQYVREEILNMSQGELASKVDTSQALVSRLENGVGGNINLLFDLVNFFYSEGIMAKEIFSNNFNHSQLKGETETNLNGQQIEELVEDLREAVDGNLDKILMLVSLLR